MRTFEIRGVVEGFYGAFYTAPERDDLIRFLGQHGYNFYFYGPKNDRQHRTRWREAYPAKIMNQFAQTIRIARESGITFCYAISPGISICYSSDEDFAILTAKLRAFYDIGARAFSLWLDDLDPEFQHDADRKQYHSFAAAHVDLCNRLYDWLQALDPTCTLSMCPTDYHGSAPFSAYIHELGAGLHPSIDIFYTGTEICAPVISAADVAAFAAATFRAPILWDNYPVNDLAMQGEMHIGPIRQRDAALASVAKGIAANPMIQAEASKIPLLTYAEYMADPICYDADTAWERALRFVAGDESYTALRRFAENSLYSILGVPEAKPLHDKVFAALFELQLSQRAIENRMVKALDDYLTELDEASYQLKFRMDNLALRNNLLPWIEALDLWVWMGRRALMVLQALERGEPCEKLLHMMREWRENALKHPKRICGQELMPISAFVEWAVEPLETSDSAAD